jgi:hypothetical protein
MKEIIMKKRTAIMVVLSACVVAPSFGAVVYIDAAPGNTTLETSGALVEGVNFTKSGSAGSASDGLWHERTRATVNGGSIWTAQAANPSTEMPKRLVTQFTLPAAGTYTICGYAWNNVDGGGAWDCGFQLGSGSNVAYTKSNATDISATSGHFTTAVLALDGAIHLMEASLGTWDTATDGLTVSVYADGGFSAAANDNRTWYDGVGYKAISELDTTGTFSFALTSKAAPPEVLSYVPGTMTTLSALSSAQSAIFELSDADRPGAYCWFQDERVIVDTNNVANPMLLTGAVTYAPAGDNKRGDIDLYWLELNSVSAGPLVRGRFELDDQLQMDDHASPSFMIRPDGRYLVNWSMHGNDLILRTRISTNPGDPSSWSATINTEPTGSGITYTNPHFLSDENGGAGRIFNGVRSRGFDSNFVYSDDLGLTWYYGGRTLDANDPWPDDRDGGRAYVKYTGDGKSKIHVFSTDDHPRVNFNEDRTAPGDLLNSIYHGYIENNKLHRSDGTVVDEDLSDDIAATPPELTPLIRDKSLLNGDEMRRGWLTDIHVDESGYPLGIIQFRANDDPDDHRYFYCRFDGQEWHVNFLAYGGDNFGYSSEPDYTGLASVDPSNPDVVFISTSSHPTTGADLISATTGLRQQEIYMGKTADFGATWTWAPLTQDSASDNLRPIVPEWTDGKSVVLWMQGSYPSFYVYDTRILGQIIEH